MPPFPHPSHAIHRPSISKSTVSLPLLKIDCKDGGFGWVIVVSSFVVHLLVVGGMNSFGVYQRYYMETGTFTGKN